MAIISPKMTSEAALSGALELALRQAHRRSDEAGICEGVVTFYCLDVDILTAYSNPHRAAEYVEVSGLLDRTSSGIRGKAGSHTQEASSAMLGVIEMLGRYLFREDGLDSARVLLPSLAEEFFGVLGAIERNYLKEVLLTVENKNIATARLQGAVSEFLKRPKTAAVDFVKELAADLQRWLPALYGPYNAAREMHRLNELLRPEDDRLIFAESIDEIAEAISSRNFELKGHPHYSEILGAWTKAVGKTFQSGDPISSPGLDRSKREWLRDNDAETLATVEWLNRWFAAKNIRARVCFLTGASRLCAAALLRFGKIENHRLPERKFSSVQTLSFGRYYALASPTFELPAASENSLCWTPIRDLRAFLVDDEFVEFLAPESNKSSDGTDSGLTAWLAVFLSSGKDDFNRVSASYLKLHGLPPASTATTFGVSDFGSSEFESLSRHWAGYISKVGAAHALERGTRHRVVADIGKIFQGHDPAALLGAHLQIQMSELVSNVGQRSIARDREFRDHETVMPATFPSRGVPPLVFSRFGNVERVIAEVMQHLSDHDRPITQIVKKVDAKLDEIATQMAPNVGLYMRLLCKAALFAVYGDWAVAQRLASQAYAVAQAASVLGTDDFAEASSLEMDSPISGREAAYFAHVASRRQSRDFRWTDIDCRAWRSRWREALEHERARRGSGGSIAMFEFHILRIQSEELALRLTGVMSEAAGKNSAWLDTESAYASAPGGISYALAISNIVEELVKLNQEARISILDGNAKGSVWYTLRQCLVNGLQFVCLSNLNKEENRATVFHWAEILLENTGRAPPEISAMIPPSQLDKLVLAVAFAWLNPGQLQLNVPPFPTPYLVYDEWRYGKYREVLGEPL